MTDFFERVAALRREGQSFAVATVVARRAPVSAHLGDRAIVFADGRMEGFVGGACSREIVRRQARASLQARLGRLVSIRPDAIDSSGSTPEHVVVPMTCASEGAIDVYIEPFVRARSLVVVGATPVAGAVARLARALEYEVVRIVDARELPDLAAEAEALGLRVAALDTLESLLQQDRGELYAVVASQGHYDEEALDVILKARPAYVGLVASRKRGATVRGLLEQGGASGAEAIRIPAGLDLGARTAPEVALSILAEIVQMQPSGAPLDAGDGARAVETAVLPASTIDPVCGMHVDPAEARHTATVDGVGYAFCCANCRMRFVDDPQSYLQPRL
jgi:xanthine dehydrogenase accessory factor